MANLSTKLAIGGAIAAVLLMLITSGSSFVTSADYMSSVSEPVEINVTSSSSASCDEWEWDGVDDFTFKKDMEVNYISIMNQIGYSLNIHLNSTVTVNRFDDSYRDTLVEFGGFSGITIDGGGKLIINDVTLYSFASEGGSTYSTEFENVSVCLSCDDHVYKIDCETDLTFNNCPLVSVDMSDTDGGAGFTTLIDVDGKLNVSNTNLKTNIVYDATDPITLIYAQGGITMSEDPSGSNIIFNDGSKDTDWENGTTVRIYTDSPTATVFVGEFPEENGSSINIYDVSLYSTIIAAIALIAIGSIYARKH